MKLLLFAVLSGIILSAAPVFAADKNDSPGHRLVDGTAWSQSSLAEKRAYIMGISDLLSVEYLYQIKSGKVPTDKQTTIQESYRALEKVSIEAAIRSIDAFYKAKPDQKALPVLGAIFIQLIEPKTKKN